MPPENSGKNRGKRKPPVGRRFKKGESGNPGGRPPMTESQREARELKAEYSPEAVMVFVKVIRSKTSSDFNKMIAAKNILEGLDKMKMDVSVEIAEVSSARDKLLASVNAALAAVDASGGDSQADGS